MGVNAINKKSHETYTKLPAQFEIWVVLVGYNVRQENCKRRYKPNELKVFLCNNLSNMLIHILLKDKINEYATAAHLCYSVIPDHVCKLEHTVVKVFVSPVLKTGHTVATVTT